MTPEETAADAQTTAPATSWPDPDPVLGRAEPYQHGGHDWVQYQQEILQCHLVGPVVDAWVRRLEELCAGWGSESFTVWFDRRWTASGHRYVIKVHLRIGPDCPMRLAWVPR